MSSVDELTACLKRIHQTLTQPEWEAIAALSAALGDFPSDKISQRAGQLISAVRERHPRPDLFQAFLQEYSLNSAEGVALMCIAEALLRIPDDATQQRFLHDKLTAGDWRRHWSHSDSLLVNLASGALSAGGGIEHWLHPERQPPGLIASLLQRVGEPVIRAAVERAMHFLAQQFVIAENIGAALRQTRHHPGYCYSFDMLGEAALTDADAERYFASYQSAIAALAQESSVDLFGSPGISVKLSALYPRYEPLLNTRAVPAVAAKLLVLAEQAKAANINLTVDAEEVERLEMSLAIFATVFADKALAGWEGLGLAVQAYQKRAPAVLDWLAALAAKHRRRIPVRLVKGAYWDTEIKRAQENGWNDYPVFTRKAATDLSYLACAKSILARPAAFYPQFATHNAHSVAAILEMGLDHPGYEFQRLHGMGEALYDTLLAEQTEVRPCRVYAPVGVYRDLLPYLVRRLLENGANSSFIHQLENPGIAVDSLVEDPRQRLGEPEPTPLPLPAALFAGRTNSQGLLLCDSVTLQDLQQALAEYADQVWTATPWVDGTIATGEPRPVFSPFDRRLHVGSVVDSSDSDIHRALTVAADAFNDWRLRPVTERSGCLLRAADLLEQNRVELLALCMCEGGRTLRDALAEVREAVDLCRYYAAEALALCGGDHDLPGPVGETNRLCYSGRGVFVCISPWNFPLAIFVGQIAAALVTGNSVIAKPAQQTSLTATLCVRLLYQAGVPGKVLQCLPGEGARIGQALLSDERVAGVAFTGSGETAAAINRQLSQRPGPIGVLIAETGGQNALIADSSAHEEQLVNDALQSAFNSAGQRCSSARVLFLPEETADAVIDRLIGAMRLLRVGSPLELATDVGPIIDARALAGLRAHLETILVHAKLLYQLPLSDELAHGEFFPPTLLEIPTMALLEREVFGPILHIVRYRSGELHQVVEAINRSGYGLTLGLHTRIDATIDFVTRHARVGNIYINRNTISAVVGAQPFGGLGLSGTGPKAGGPNYLQRFTVEQTISNNIAAMGGNPWLLAK